MCEREQLGNTRNELLPDAINTLKWEFGSLPVHMA